MTSDSTLVRSIGIGCRCGDFVGGPARGNALCDMFENAESLCQEVRNAVTRVYPDFPAVVAQEFLETLKTPTEALCATAELVLKKPYGKNHILRIGPTYGLSFACLVPGASTSLHYHRQRRELFFVRAGVLCFTSAEMDR